MLRKQSVTHPSQRNEGEKHQNSVSRWIGASKHTFMGLALVAMGATALLAGCEKEKEEAKPEGIPTTINILSSKTTYQGGAVVWDEGDQIAVIRGMSSASNAFSAFDIASGVGTSDATFTGTVTGTEDNYHVVYPYMEDITIDDAGLHLAAVKPHQTLRQASFGLGDNVSVGVSDNTNVYMQNVGGLLKVVMQGDGNLQKIVITANDGTKLAGNATVPLYGDNSLNITFDGDAVSTIEAEAPTPDGIDISGGKTFYIAMPPCTLNNYSITLVGTNGMEEVHTFTEPLTIQRAYVTRTNLTATLACKMYYTTTDNSNLLAKMNSIASANNTTCKVKADGNGGWVAIFNSPITSLQNFAFQNCSTLASVTIPNSVTSIGSSAFSYCSSLASVTIPDSVTSIGYYAFKGCSALASVTIPDSVTSIGSSAFEDCSALASVTIPNSVTSINTFTFNGCSSLKSVTIPDGVTSIGNYAFMKCSSLASVTIPNSVNSIGTATFQDCSALASVTIPNSVNSIGASAFQGCSALVSVNISNSVNSIGTATFQDCSALASVTIPNSVNSIGASAFQGCSALTSVTINSVTSIGNFAFLQCSSLASVTIPNSVTYIGDYAFVGCSTLTSVYCHPIVAPTLGNMVFTGITSRATLYTHHSATGYTSGEWTYFTKKGTL